MPAPILLQKFAKFYNGNFDRRPVPTLMITNGILNGIADAVAQSSQMLLARQSMPHPHTAEFEPPPPQGYDPARTLRFVTFGVAMGPLIGVWMRFLERNIPLLAIFVSAMGFMEGKNTDEVKDKFDDVCIHPLLHLASINQLSSALEPPRQITPPAAARPPTRPASLAPRRPRPAPHGRPGGRARSIFPETITVQKPEEEEWEEEADAVAASQKRDTDDEAEHDDDDDEDDEDELVITTKPRKRAPAADDNSSQHGQGDAPDPRRPLRGFTLTPPPPAPAPRHDVSTSAHTTSAAPAQADAQRNSPSPAPSESGTLIAPASVPTSAHLAMSSPQPEEKTTHSAQAAAAPVTPTTTAAPSRHLRTRNSHTSLRSLTNASLRILAPSSSAGIVAPHHPLSSPSSSVRTFRGQHPGTATSTASAGGGKNLAPPVVSGELARGLWSTASNGGGVPTTAVAGGYDIDGLPSSSFAGTGKRPAAASASLRKASFSTPSPSITGTSRSVSAGTATTGTAGLPLGGGSGGRLSAHSVAQKAAQLPTLSSRPSARPGDVRHERERETVNLVSRFIVLPASYPTASSAGTTVVVDSTKPTAASIFPDSPFATAHRSLVRTMMEESARVLPVTASSGATAFGSTTTGTAANNNNGGGGGGSGGSYYPDHSLSPRLLPSRVPALPTSSAAAAAGTSGGSGAAGGAGGVEWVPGLTPFEMSVQRCLEQRKGAVRLATGEALAPLAG
ncbi:hypothetical protein QFC19_002260 [Naganishia cerealis]|uniref:Uncharacterized protein n=1 Tax=Naganishia cerealis TaxID=610337 RepID=A0ACC2WBD2_9TREE|nr:hypothetical protein QFC19_002260 [Naganishia cerealis]